MIERYGADYWEAGEGAPFDQEWRYEIDRDASLHVSPRRVLAECEAKRRIVELAQGSVTEIAWTAIGCSETTDPGDTEAPEKILRALALPYAEHPDYREGWKV
jgi:hypothetical protein